MAADLESLEVLKAKNITLSAGLGATVALFEITDVRTNRVAQFVHVGPMGDMGFAPATLFGPTTAYTEFRTTGHLELEDFAGEAAIYQGPNITLGPRSLGDSQHLRFKSQAMRDKRVILHPEKDKISRNMVPITTGPGFGLTVFSVSDYGELIMIGSK